MFLYALFWVNINDSEKNECINIWWIYEYHIYILYFSLKFIIINQTFSLVILIYSREDYYPLFCIEGLNSFKNSSLFCPVGAKNKFINVNKKITV